jgi:hypothetical protein
MFSSIWGMNDAHQLAELLFPGAWQCQGRKAKTFRIPGLVPHILTPAMHTYVSRFLVSRSYSQARETEEETKLNPVCVLL